MLSLSSPTAAADLSFLAGPAAYDLSAKGATLSASIRLTQKIIPWVRVEAALSLARPAPRDETRCTLYQPEAGILLCLPLERWTPYVSIAAGAAAFDEPNSAADWEISLSGGAGAFIPLTPRLSLRPDFRIRGLGDSLSAFIADFHLGLALHL